MFFGSKSLFLVVGGILLVTKFPRTNSKIKLSQNMCNYESSQSTFSVYLFSLNVKEIIQAK